MHQKAKQSTYMDLEQAYHSEKELGTFLSTCLPQCEPEDSSSVISVAFLDLSYSTQCALMAGEDIDCSLGCAYQERHVWRTPRYIEDMKSA